MAGRGQAARYGLCAEKRQRPPGKGSRAICFANCLGERKGLKRKYRKPPQGAEELERKARFPALAPEMRPKKEDANSMPYFAALH